MANNIMKVLRDSNGLKIRKIANKNIKADTINDHF